MIVSYNWLNKRFFNEQLPPPGEIADVLMFGAFEIDDIEEKGDAGDTIIDVSVLPNRAHDALSHRGIAREIGALTGTPMTYDPLRDPFPDLTVMTEDVRVEVKDTERCPVYTSALIRGVRVAESPDWLKAYLSAIGQKPINTIVDATNFVMFELGQPLHAFDAKKLTTNDKGQMSIHVRPAKKEECITVLGGDTYELTEDMTVIADGHSDAPLAIAGVKGGEQAEVGPGTVDIILEAAKFDPARTRKTSQTLKLRTDSSHRFENEIPDELPYHGLKAVVALIQEIAGGEVSGFTTTELSYKMSYTLGVSVSEVNARLGTKLSEQDIMAILEKLNFSYERVEDPVSKVLELAPTFEGVPYKLGERMCSSVPHVFECSTLTAYLYAQVGVSIPRVSIDQYLWGEPVEEPEPGDLVFSNYGNGNVWRESVTFLSGARVPEGIDHVGLYVGNGNVIHASKKAGGVVTEVLKESPAFGTIVGFRRMLASNEPRFVITVPFERLDMRIPEDLIEEIGRVYGYRNIEGISLPASTQGMELNTVFWMAERVRNVLGKRGYTEVYTYSLRDRGDVALQNALASDKGMLRADLSSAISEKLDMNAHNAPLLGLDAIRIFEIGNVFAPDEECVRLCVGTRFLSGKKRGERALEEMREIQAMLEEALGDALQCEYAEETFECRLSEDWDISGEKAYDPVPHVAGGIVYTPTSPYPFALRDIALWVSQEMTAEEIGEIIRITAGPLLVRCDLFDEFTKEDRTSYAFHLVFQSDEKTLTDEEVHGIMRSVEGALTQAGGEIR